MKRIIGIFILVVSLTSCSDVIGLVEDMTYEGDYSYIPLYYGDFDNIQDTSDIPRWMRSKVQYEVSDVQSPKETLDKGTGDCDCYAILYMNITYILFDIKCNLVLTNNSGGDLVNHAVVRLPSGKMINAQTGTDYNGPTYYEYDFDIVFKRR